MEFSKLMKLSAIFCFITLNFHSSSGVNDSTVIVVLPGSSSDVQTSLEKSEEILPQVEEAIEDINNSNILNDTNLKLVTAVGDFVLSKDKPYSGNALEIVANFTWQNKSVIGIAGLIHPSILPALQAFQLPIATLIGTSMSPDNSVLSLTAPTSILTDSILAFMAVINQTNIGVISESTHSYYSTISNNLIVKANISLYLHSSSRHPLFSSNNIVDKIANSNVRVILLSVRPSIAVSILLEACKHDMKWPNYAWILHSYRFKDIHKLATRGPSVDCGKSDTGDTLENIFIFQLAREFESDANGVPERNPFGVLLQDAIWALAFTASSKSFDNHVMSFTDATNKYRHFSEVYIYQAWNMSAELIGVYSGTSNSLMNFTNISTFAYDGPLFVRLQLQPSVLVISILCFLFNTLLMILYVSFRNHPDVKSTNISLSMLIFIGCYLLIGFAIVQFFGYSFPVDLCMVSTLMGGLGLSGPLIVATVLVKMLQVYRIFNLQRRIKRSVYMKYVAPYVLLILTPCLLIYTLWMVIDPLRITNTYVEYPGFTVVVDTCTSMTYPIWYTLVISYQVILCLATVCIAVKTRKIRLSQFKDTKKVNLFIFLILFAGNTCFAYWLALRFIDPHGSSCTYVLIVGHIVLALITQFTLFVPKLWTPLREKLPVC